MITIEQVLRWCGIGAIFLLTLVPWIVIDTMFFPFITGKNFAFRLLVEFLASVTLALTFIDARYRVRKSWIVAAFALFILVMAIADAQGANPFKSFWSNYERMDGWITIAHIFLLVVCASIVMNTEKLWRWLFETTLAVSACLSVYGLFQVFGTLALGQGGSNGLSARIDATFGNPIYLAVYMLFHVFFAALLWIQSREKNGAFRLWLSLWYGAVIVLDTLALFFTGTRGTILGLIGGIAVTALLMAFFSNTAEHVRRGAIIVLATLAILAAGFWGIRHEPWVQKVGFLQRLATISTSDTTIASRFTNMSIAWQGVKERPIFGWGQENYAIVFDKYYDPRMYADEPWFDRVHDIIFDWWIAGGTLGLFAYLSIFAAVLWSLWSRGPNGSYAFSVPERSIIMGLLAGYFIHNLTVFDNVTSYILFGFLLAYIVFREGDRTSRGTIPWRTLGVSYAPALAVMAAVVFVGAAWGVNANAYAENVTLLRALEQQSDPTANLALLDKAIGYGTYGTQEAREQLAQIAVQIVAAQGVSDSVKQSFVKDAIQQMTLQAQISPLDARFPLFIGTVYDAAGDYTDAGIALQKAHELSPRKQTILFQVGFNQLAQGDTKSAEQTFKQAFELEEDYTQARVYYAAAAIHSGDDATADELLQPIIATGAAADQQIASAYSARKEYSKIIPIWSAYVKNNPTDTQGYLVLAAAYYQNGDTADAVSVLQQGAQNIPSRASDFAQLVQSVKAHAI